MLIIVCLVKIVSSYYTENNVYLSNPTEMEKRMNKVKFLACTLMFLIAGFTSHAVAGDDHQFDKATFSKIAKKTIGRVISGNIDADAMIADMEKLVALGVEGCKEHMTEAETPSDEVKVMQLVIDNASSMGSMSLAKIEEQWHEGSFVKANGADINGFDHFSEVLSHYDTVVHPATAIICLKQYKVSGDEALLEQVQDELAEVNEHIAHL